MKSKISKKKLKIKRRKSKKRSKMKKTMRQKKRPRESKKKETDSKISGKNLVKISNLESSKILPIDKNSLNYQDGILLTILQS